MNIVGEITSVVLKEVYSFVFHKYGDRECLEIVNHYLKALMCCLASRCSSNNISMMSLRASLTKKSVFNPKIHPVAYALFHLVKAEEKSYYPTATQVMEG